MPNMWDQPFDDLLVTRTIFWNLGLFSRELRYSPPVPHASIFLACMRYVFFINRIYTCFYNGRKKNYILELINKLHFLLEIFI